MLQTRSCIHELPIPNSNVFCDGDSGKTCKQSECPKQVVEPTTFLLLVRDPFGMVTPGNSTKAQMVQTSSRIYDLLITSSYALPLRDDEDDDDDDDTNDDDDVDDDGDDDDDDVMRLWL